MKEYAFDLHSEILSPDVKAAYDVVILAKGHDGFDCQLIKVRSQLIIRTRGSLAVSPHATRA